MSDTQTIRQAVTAVYAEAGDRALNNDELYNRVADKLDMPAEAFNSREKIGRDGTLHSKAARTARWQQQTMRLRGLLEKVQGERGTWQLTGKGKAKLTAAPAGQVLVAFSTELGVALWCDMKDGIQTLDDQITLYLSSPPYPLAKSRAYGNVGEQQYVDWLCQQIEGVVRCLRPGGSIVLNLSNDIFNKGQPDRSLYIERLVLALTDRFGLSLMDRLIWSNPSKAPGPVQWASLHRYHLNTGYEPVLWFTNDPTRVIANNQAVLQPHSERHQALIDRGGERRTTNNADGAYRLRAGRSFARATEGTIPKNVLEIGHRCRSQQAYKNYCRQHGLPVHGAPMPYRLVDLLVRWLSNKGDLVADGMAGSLTVPLAAETHERYWWAFDLNAEYLLGGMSRFDPS